VPQSDDPSGEVFPASVIWARLFLWGSWIYSIAREIPDRWDAETCRGARGASFSSSGSVVMLTAKAF